MYFYRFWFENILLDINFKGVICLDSFVDDFYGTEGQYPVFLSVESRCLGIKSNETGFMDGFFYFFIKTIHIVLPIIWMLVVVFFTEPRPLHIKNLRDQNVI